MAAAIVLVLLIVGVLAVILMAGVGLYNGLVARRVRYQNAYAQIDVQLKRRHDLIPNLVETAKGYMAHERGTLEAVIAARGAAVTASAKMGSGNVEAQTLTQVSAAEGALSGALGKLLAVVESYPNLKADTQMSQLMEELTSTENRIAFARQAYNDSVMSYNTARSTFPGNLVAARFNFAEAPLWAMDNVADREPVNVSFTK